MALIGDGEYPLSTECVDSAEGYPGVIVYDDLTFPISPPQSASDDEEGPYSSVRPFQTTSDDGDEEGWDLPETDGALLDCVVEEWEEESEEHDLQSTHLQPLAININ
ncbi:hypothetical protein PFLUV_G00212480 [Xyrichtys novacula]|uniref:Uncharacterized protein n=1 Tax=Xyrichtys novacula TaxID=13765 RepID=A0AAV1GWQ7_XYRNO|nr:hypothetical protein PFLUV_G00212480 [Xyrichtys novacula]